MKAYMFLFIGTLSLLASVFLFSHSAHGDEQQISINEIGAYEASGYEWIEVVNVSDAPIDMTGWKFFEDNTNHSLTLAAGEEAVLTPGSYALIVQNAVLFAERYPDIGTLIFDSSWGSLNESGEAIGLKNADGEFVEQFTYVSSPDTSLERLDPRSLEYTEANWQAHPNGNSVGKQNYWHTNQPSDEPAEDMTAPIALFSVSSSTALTFMFDASSSTDNIGITSYMWDFGDGSPERSGATTTHTYSGNGTYTVTLTTTDAAGNAASTSTDIHLENEPAPDDGILFLNEFVSNPQSGETEWIELYNRGQKDASLEGWTLEDGAGRIATITSTVRHNDFFVVDLTSAKLNNEGDIIVLKNATGDIVDSLSYGDWQGATLSAPKKGESGARDTTWIITTTPTKGTQNTITHRQEEDPPPTSGGGGGAAPIVEIFVPKNIVINELVSDPQDEEVEFVELFNTTDTSISLTGWTLEDGSEAVTNLEGSILPHDFFVIESPKGNLNNTGDIVILYAPDNTKINAVTYGTWDDGNLSDNAPAPKDPTSLARRADGVDADNDIYDFVLTDTITKGASNIISLISADGMRDVLGTKLYGSSIYITEIFPNPKGSDTDDEFIELYNSGDKTIDITGWKLGDSSKKRYTISDGVISSGSFVVLKRAMTGIALNNSGGESVGLYTPDGVLSDETRFAGSAAEGQSYAKTSDGSWAWTTKVTPSETNIIEGKSSAPIISLDADVEVAVDEQARFDASDTTDPDGDDMTFVWTFGDNGADEGDIVEHAFSEEGTYTVTLLVTDSRGNASTKDVIVMVKHRLSFADGVSFDTPLERIEISELLPNPEGSDTTEFIELYNPTDETLTLSDLKLDDEEGGSRAYTIPDGVTIAPHAYLVFGRQETKLALNNTSDSVRILYPDGTILTEVRYDDVIEGHSYVQDENESWIWTSSVTPGAATIISPPNETKKSTTTKSKSKMIQPTIETTLAGLRGEDIGDRITTAGSVAVLPDIFGSQYFYIVEDPSVASSSSAGVQVYMYSKDFPSLALGDVIQITGEISESGGETRVKLADATDIVLNEHKSLPTAKPIDIAQIGEEFEGWFVEVHGEITEIKSSYLYVDDGTDEVQVYFKRGAGITSKIYELGDLVRIDGIVSQTKTGYRLLPRSADDIQKTGIVEDVVIEKKAEATEDSKEIAEKYLTATAGGLTALILGLLAKMENSPFKKIGTFLKKQARKKNSK